VNAGETIGALEATPVLLHEQQCSGEVDHCTVLVSVTDNGGGIPNQDIPVLFQAFRQLNAGLQYKGKGTGLGLAICLEIVAKHGGRVGVRNCPDAGGATFLVAFRLPVLHHGNQHTEGGDQHTSLISSQQGDQHTSLISFQRIREISRSEQSAGDTSVSFLSNNSHHGKADGPRPQPTLHILHPPEHGASASALCRTGESGQSVHLPNARGSSCSSSASTESCVPWAQSSSVTHAAYPPTDAPAAPEDGAARQARRMQSIATVSSATPGPVSALDVPVFSISHRSSSVSPRWDTERSGSRACLLPYWRFEYQTGVLVPYRASDMSAAS
jgi:hypothetical protein